MNIRNRVEKLEKEYASVIEDITILTLAAELLKLVIKIRGGTTLRIVERWKEKRLIRYSYYWLDNTNNLKIGWDNAPHHRKIQTFPHHKHVGEKLNITESNEMCLEDVMKVIKSEINKAS